MKTIAVIQNVPIYLDDIEGEAVTFLADADIDADGSGGNPYGDPYFEPRTSLRYKGASLNSRVTPFIVVPPAIIQHTQGAVLGCLALVTHVLNHKSCICVVGDVGPARKVGELSIAAAREIDVPWNPVTGGEDRRIIRYTIRPGVPAWVRGVRYDLQPWKA